MAYDVGTTNYARTMRFRVQGHGGSAAANIFLILKGASSQYPYYGAIQNPTANQVLAQLRVSMVVRALARYAPPVLVEVGADSSSNAAGALFIAFETDQMGVYNNPAWETSTANPKGITTDITDSVGTGGMSVVKTKDGLAKMLAGLATLSYDGGTTGPFGALSTTGNIVLPDGSTTSGAPSLATGVGAGFESGLEVAYIGT